MKKFAVFVLNLAIFAGICVSFVAYVGWNKIGHWEGQWNDGFDYFENLEDENYAAIFENAEKNKDNKDYPRRAEVASLYASMRGGPNFKKAAEFYQAEEKLRGLGFSDMLELSLIFARGGFGIEKNQTKADEYFFKAMSLVDGSGDDSYSEGKVSTDAFFTRAVQLSQSDSELFKQEENLLAAKMLKYAIENDFHFEEGTFFALPLAQNSLMGGAVEVLRRHILEGKKEEKIIYIKLMLEGKYAPRDYGEIFRLLSGEYEKNKYGLDVRDVALLAVLYKNGLGVAVDPKKVGEILDYLKKVSDPADFSGGWNLEYIVIASRNIYSGEENYPQDKELALEIAKMAENIISSSDIKKASFAFGYLVNFYKKYVKDLAKVEELYKLYAPKSKEIELKYQKFLNDKK
ncbi:MAG: hypothetical protein IKO42_07860 [Opitutales bacterium]|nr:hypothetical protein [Opitutales bacterium]